MSDQTTNDKQASYLAQAEANAMEKMRAMAKKAVGSIDEMLVKKAMEQPKPLLSDEDAGHLAWTEYAKTSSPEVGGIAVRDWYERKIASGELTVVKTANIIFHRNDIYECSSCGKKYEGYRETYAEPPEIGEFCKCGAKIIAQVDSESAIELKKRDAMFNERCLTRRHIMGINTPKPSGDE